jgi:hypothetical protein
MYASLRGRLRPAGLCLVLVIVAIASQPGERASAQEAPMRWDGLIELISGRYPYPTPAIEPPTPADAASTMARHAISADGRYILFNSDATNLGFSQPGLYLRDRQWNETHVLLAGPAQHGTLSADGNHVAFEICDTYASPNPRPDGAPICDIYGLDLRWWQWSHLSALPDGSFADDHSNAPVLSSTGRFVVFRTKAVNLTGGAPGVSQLVLRDRDADGNGVFDEPGTAIVETISGGAGGVGDADSDTPEVSDDGRFVAFRSLASNLVPGDTNAAWDVFLRDRQTQQTRRINLSGGVQQSLFSIDSPQISMTPDGRYIAYASADPMLAPAAFDDLNGVLDVFVHDAWSGTTSRVDVGWGPPVALGLVPGNGPTSWPTLSADGRYVSVQSAATNVETPPLPGSTHTYVADLALPRVVRVSVRPDGTDADRDAVTPSISADGSLVTFVSQALNLSPLVQTEVDRIYSAVHFEITPSEVIVPGSGGFAAFTITAQQYTQWWLDWTEWADWWQFEVTPYGIGNGEIRFRIPAPNPNPTPRSYTVRVLSKSALLTQLEGMSMTSITPSSGPASGGTTVTITGTGFAPGVWVMFDGFVADTQFVNSTTITATTPPHLPGPVWVGAMSADYQQSAWIDQGFDYVDSSPPEVYAAVNGEQGEDGWFRGNVGVSFAWFDNESPVTSTTGCDPVVVSTDTPGTTFTCSVTTEGGTGTASITIKRDGTAPTIAIASPAERRLFEAGEVAASSFTCSDSLSGISACGVSAPSGAPIDTSTSGWRTFGADARDRAGNLGSRTVEYAVATNVCVAGLPTTTGWWRMEGNTSNTRGSVPTPATRVGLTADVYVDAIVGQGYQFEGVNGYLRTPFAIPLPFSLRFGMSAWVKPSANTYGTILRKKDQYSLARTAHGTIAWAFRKFNVTTLSYYDTGVAVPLNQWSHIVVALEGSTVRTYLNGRLAHTATNVGDVYTWDGMYELITIGGAQDRGEYFKGVIDEVQLFSQMPTEAHVEQLYLSGPAGACVPKVTQFVWTPPIQATFGSPTYRVELALRDENGEPVVNRAVHLESIVGAQPYSTSAADRVTDANGVVIWDAPLKNAPVGNYPDFLSAMFVGDDEYVRTYVEPAVVVIRATPTITWPTPAPITYGSWITSAQLNATANVAGAFSYSPPSGTVLAAGSHTLTANFTPSNSTNYTTATGSVTLTVNKAMPTVTVTGGAHSFDGQPHPATGSVRGIGNVDLGQPTFTYNGALDPPVNAGTYDVVGSFAGNANYQTASATATITIGKATSTVTVEGGSFSYDGQPHAATGSVTGAGGAVLGPLTLTYNSSPDAPSTAGTYEVVASFAGDANHEASSGSATITIAKAAPQLTWNQPAPVVHGTPLGAAQLNATANVPGSFVYTPAAGAVLNAGAAQSLSAQFTPADAVNYTGGTVTATIDVAKAAAAVSVTGGAFTYDGQPHPATGTVTGNGGAALGPLTFTYNGQSAAPVNAATYAVVASFAGDANHDAASATATITIGKAAPGLAWSAPAAILYGTPLGGAQLSASSNVAGSFAYTPGPGTVLPAGSHSLGATFTPADPANYSGGTVGVTIAVVPAPLTVRANDAIKPFGAPLPPFGASVAGLVNGDTPASLIGTLGFVTAATPQSPVGGYAITPGGLASPNYAIAFANGTLSIVKGATATVVSTSPEPSGAGQPMTFTAAIGATAPASGAPSGVVQFFDGAALLGTSPIAGGIASLTTAGLSSGSHTIEARYLGDASFEASVATSTHVIRTTSSTPTISLSSSRNPASTGQSVTLTANLSMSSGSVTGSVQFWDGDTLLATSTISAGRATWTTSSLANGSHAITARYLGSASAAPSNSGVLVQAVGGSGWRNRSTSASVASSANPTAVGNPISLTATIVGSWSAVPTGRVLFMIDGTVVGDPSGVAVTLVSGTTVRAVLAVPGLARGSRKVTVTYLGDVNYKGSTAALTQTVN